MKQPDPFVVTSADGAWGDGRILDANPAFEMLTGLNAGDIRNKPYCQLLEAPAKVGAPEAADIEATVVLCGPPNRNGPAAAGTAFDGRRVHIHAVALPDDDGLARMRVIAHRPIGATAAGLRPERAAGDPYRALFDTVAAGVFVHREFRPLFANKACARLLGLDSVADVLAQPTLLRFLSSDRLSTLLERHARLLAGGRPPEPHFLQCVSASGAPFWAEVSETPIDWQGERAVAVTVLASGGQARTHRIEALLREAIDTLSDSFVLYDADDRAVLTNKRFHEIFPFLPPQDTVAGARMVDLVRAGVSTACSPPRRRTTAIPKPGLPS